ncbi:hypothetical protein ACVWZM_002682 [Bradyrhizobium sp. USDA 4501]
MSRHQRRADLADFKRKASHSVRTYLVEPGDRRLASAPLLRAAAADWLDNLSRRARTCIICSQWLPSRQSIGALLMSTPDVVRPTSVGTAAVCLECWQADLPLDALDRAVERTLRCVVPNGKLEPLIAPRLQR